MKSLIRTCILLSFLMPLGLASDSLGRPAKSLLHDQELPLLASPDLKAPLDKSFRVAKGQWTVEDGVLKVLDLPAEKHIPVLHHLVGLSDAVIEVEFLLDGPGIFIVGCDSNKHVGRVIISAKRLSIAEDSVKPSHSIAHLAVTTKTRVWHHLRVEWKGGQMAVNLDGHKLNAQHAYLATPKSRSWIAAGKSVKIRNLKISGIKTQP
ncbi:MAG: hypothetical protein QM496_15890 [Verrucomicrobiota bacterium]